MQGILGPKDYAFRDHDGTLLYTGAVDKEMPVGAAISIIRLEGVSIDKLYRYHLYGPYAYIVESLAQFLLSNPGMAEAVSGMMQGLKGQAMLEVQLKQQGGPR